MRKKRICTEFNQVERNGGEGGGEAYGCLRRDRDTVGKRQHCGWVVDQAKAGFELGLSKMKRRRRD